MMCRVKRAQHVAAVIVCVVTLGGCSALSGRDVKVSPVHPASSPATSSSTPVLSDGGARLQRPATVAKVLAAAKQAFETIYTFDYRHLDKYRTAGLKLTTNPYSTRYSAGLSGATAKELRQLQQVQVPSADHVAIVELTGSDRSATVIVNGRIVTSSTETTAPTSKQVTVALHLKLVGGAWKVNELTEGGKKLGPVPANQQLRSALAVSRSCIDKIFGLTRAHFDRDFSAVMNCTTGELHGRLQTSRGSQRQTLTDGNYDLSSSIVGLGVGRADGGSAELVVVLDEYRLTREGSKSGPYPLVFDVIVLRANGKWLLSSATQVS
jgi:hypothetical protein